MSAIGTKRTYRVALHMSAIGGKADMPFCTAKCPLMTKSGHVAACHVRPLSETNVEFHFSERTPASCVGLIRPVEKEVSMHREQEYKHLADNARKRGGEEQNAQLRAQWEILAATYLQLADQSKKIDDTGTYADPLERTRH
jgi:hypothetical protein